MPLLIQPCHRLIKVHPALLHAVQHASAGTQLGPCHGFIAILVGELGELQVGDGEVALPLGKVVQSFSSHDLRRPNR